MSKREKDHYELLGIPRDTSREALREAFRVRLKASHPDVAGPGPDGDEPVREVIEAYRVLSDPQERERYDRDLRRREHTTDSAPDELPSYWPLRSFAPFFAPFLPFDDVLEGILSAFFSGAAGLQRQKVRVLEMQVELTAEEATAGGAIPVTLPLQQRCPECGGVARAWPSRCGRCGGGGMLGHDFVVELEIPRGARDGDIIDKAVTLPTIGPVVLRVHLIEA